MWLGARGGSWYSAIAGIVMMWSGVLLVARHRAGAWLYWLVLAGTAAWTAWESGFDYWRWVPRLGADWGFRRSEEHTSELQSLMRISYAVFCLKKKKHQAHREEYRGNYMVSIIQTSHRTR